VTNGLSDMKTHLSLCQQVVYGVNYLPADILAIATQVIACQILGQSNPALRLPSTKGNRS
jgi:hypothetical protein